MLIQKKEQFRQEIRKQTLEEIFKQRRNKLMSKRDVQQSQDQMNDELVDLYNQVDADQNFCISKFPVLKQILNSDLTNLTILLLQLIVKKYKDSKQTEILDTLFEDYHLGQRILYMCDKEENLVYLDEQLYLLSYLSQSSQLCQATILQFKIAQCLNKIIDLEIESDDYLMSAIMFLITTFIEPNSRIPFKDVQQFMQILDKLCKKLGGINYLYKEFDLENNQKYSETKHSLLSRILLFTRYYIDKSQFTTNLTLYQNFWIILTNLAFVVQEQHQLRQTALQVISDSMKLNDQQLKFDIIEKYPDIFFQLLTIIDHHQQTNKTADKSIRTQASIIMKQLFSEQSQYIIQNIHMNQIPLQFLILVKREKDHQVLYHQLDALFLLCSNSSFEQCTELYNNGLLTFLISIYQEIKEQQDFVLGKQLIKLTFAILEHKSSDHLILNFLKENQIISCLNYIVNNCKNGNICRNANQLLKYIY